MTKCPASGPAGEKARNKRAAIMPTGKNKSINGGGGSGGSINGRTTKNNARHASTRADPKLIHCTIISTTSSDFRRPYLSSIRTSPTKMPECSLQQTTSRPEIFMHTENTNTPTSREMQ
ncbi:hypothetical protein ACFX2A_040921 [Malus domestica]|uniref:Uncharacterized protein n=1 Tax=Malus domestica TaxID=3750 RepID=A0A498JFA5_MALDO|nr:hypothetical protein DVH24_015873 [Malus domestica]